VSYKPEQLPDLLRTLERAKQRFDGAEGAMLRLDVSQGEIDNNYEGVVNAINFIVQAYVLGTTGIQRKFGEAEASTKIESVLSTLGQQHISNLPSAKRLRAANARRNESGHEGSMRGEIDTDEVEAAIHDGRLFMDAVIRDLRRRKVLPSAKVENHGQA